jgi:hypothetical protein
MLRWSEEGPEGHGSPRDFQSQKIHKKMSTFRHHDLHLDNIMVLTWCQGEDHGFRSVHVAWYQESYHQWL